MWIKLGVDLYVDTYCKYNKCIYPPIGLVIIASVTRFLNYSLIPESWWLKYIARS